MAVEPINKAAGNILQDVQQQQSSANGIMGIKSPALSQVDESEVFLAPVFNADNITVRRKKQPDGAPPASAALALDDVMLINMEREAADLLDQPRLSSHRSTSSESSKGSSYRTKSSKQRSLPQFQLSSSSSKYLDKLNEEKARIAELRTELEFQRQVQEAEERKRVAEEENRRAVIEMQQLTVKREMAKAEARAKVFERAERDIKEGSGCESGLADVTGSKYFVRSPVARGGLPTVSATKPAASGHSGILAELEATKDHTAGGKKLREEVVGEPSIFQELKKHLALRDAPVLQVDAFDGNPLNYHYFVAMFKEVVENKIEDPLGRLTRLIQLTTGEAKELIKHCIQETPSSGYVHAKQLLEEQYGNKFRVATAYVKEIKSWPALREGSSAEYRRLFRFLVKCQALMSGGQCLSELDSPEILRCLQSKLPKKGQESWNRKVLNIRKKSGREPLYSDFFEFFDYECNLMNDPMYSREALKEFDEDKLPKQRSNVRATEVAEVPCVFCEGAHDIEECSEFKGKDLPERSQWCMDNRICFGCLGRGHLSRNCKNRRTCSICKKSHPTILHRDKEEPVLPVEEESLSRCVCISSQRVISMSIVPVVFSYTKKIERGKKIKCEKVLYALLDACSNGTFIKESVLDDLGIKGTSARTSVKTMTGIKTENRRYLLGASVRKFSVSQKDTPVVGLPKTYTAPTLPIERYEIPSHDQVVRWKHLQKIADEFLDNDSTIPIGLLIGSNCPSALQPHGFIHSENDGPFATKTILGWTISGPIDVHGGEGDNVIRCNRIAVKDVVTRKISKHHFAPTSGKVKDCSVGDMLNELYLTDFNESIGKSESAALSVEDKRFMKMMDEQGRYLQDGHYELPLPLRNENVCMPNNRVQALRLAESEKRRFLKDPKYFEDVNGYMKEIFDGGFAEIVSSDDVVPKGKEWFLPYHGVYHPQKPGKIRVVFNCSMKYEGRSLNSELLQGPDLMNQLIGVLIRFRKEPVPFVIEG